MVMSDVAGLVGPTRVLQLDPRQRRWKELEEMPRKARRRWKWLTSVEVAMKDTVGWFWVVVSMDGSGFKCYEYFFHQTVSFHQMIFFYFPLFGE